MPITSSRLKPALVLLVLSPAIGELLSGSAPPVEFFHPFSFLLLVSLYGSGAIIVRELRVRWKKGVGSMLLLGAAYGVLEEGVMVCSFFNPNWPDLGQMGVYGRWFDVNWVWALMLTTYHAAYSITIPILLVELAYPEQRDEHWVSGRTFKTVLLLLIGVVVLGFVLFNVLSGYSPPLLPYCVTVATVFLFGYAAYTLPKGWTRSGNRPLDNTPIIWILGVVGTFAFFFGFWLMPTLIPAWPIGILLSLALLVLATSFLKRYDWNVGTYKHRFALVSGMLIFFIVFAPLQEFDVARTDNPAGMSLVSLAFLIGLILLKRRVWVKSTHGEGGELPIRKRGSALTGSGIRGYCVNCSAELLSIAAYCPQCGTKVDLE